MKSFDVKFLLTVVTLVGVGWTAASEGDEKAVYNKELEKLAGTWQLICSEKDGAMAPEDQVKQTKIILTGDKYTIERAGQTIEKGWIALDPTQKPKVIDIYPTKPEGKVQMGIYEWDGEDKVKVCCTHPGTGQTRPSLFSTTKGTGHVMSVLKREKLK